MSSARSLLPANTNGPTFDVRNGQVVLDFDASTVETCYLESVLVPTGATVATVSILWAATSATSGNVVWSVAVERKTTTVASDSFATASTATAAANGTNGVPTTTTLTPGIDSAAAGDFVRLRIRRDATSGSDTMTGDAEVYGVSVEWS